MWVFKCYFLFFFFIFKTSRYLVAHDIGDLVCFFLCMCFVSFYGVGMKLWCCKSEVEKVKKKGLRFTSPWQCRSSTRT